MKVGDLVKVYDFSHEARKRLAQKSRPGEETPEWASFVGAHYVGLIVPTKHIVNDKHRRILRGVDGEQEYYNVNRLEVINESR